MGTKSLPKPHVTSPMKNPFPLASAILSTTYPAAIAAELLGVLPSSVINFPTFIGFFTVSGVLAVAFSEYSRKAPSYDAPRLKRQQPQSAKRTQPAVPPGAAWSHHTVSA